MSNSSLSEQLPYWEFESDPFAHAVLFDGSLSTGLELLPLDIECFDEARINQLTQGLRAFANSLPEGMTCQFMVKVETDLDERLSSHLALVKTDNTFLRNLDQGRASSIRQLIEHGAVFRPRLFLLLKTAAPAQPGRFSVTQTKRFSASFEKGYHDRLQTLSQVSDGSASALSSLGFVTRKIERDGIVDLLYQYLNPKRADQLQAPSISPRSNSLENESPRSQLVFGDLVLGQEDFLLDRTRTRVLTLKTLPEMTFAGMMSAFLAFPFKYELIFSFQVTDQAKEMAALQQKRRMAHSLAGSSSTRVSDLESESRLGQTTNLIREIIETGQQIFQAQLTIVLRDAATPEGDKRLNLHTKEVLSRFKTLSGSEGMQETVGAWKIFKSDLPFAPLDLIRNKRMKTNNLVDFLPMYGAATGDDLPVCLMNTRLGTLYSFNPYDPRLPNYNMLVTGSSGSGKSFANNFLMLQQIARGVQVFIIDIGGSYKKMTEVLGGQYFEINLSDDYAINPFELSDPSQAPSGDRLKGLVSIVEQMVVDQGEKLSRFERVQVESALASVFETARNAAKPSSPTLSDLSSFCKKSEEESLRRIAKLLFPWVGSTPFGRLLDRPGQIAANRPVVAFDLKGLSQYPDLQSVMILILTNFILEQVEKDRTIQKRVLLDEAWELLKSPAASLFMEYAARTFRKTGSGITFITQGVEEIISSGIGPAILNNTATKLVMLQRGDTNVLRDALHLNSQELRLIQSLEQRKGVFSEGFLMEAESRQVIRIQPSPIEYWISTSDARDNLLISRYVSEGLSLEEALSRAASVAPFGVAFMKGGAA